MNEDDHHPSNIKSINQANYYEMKWMSFVKLLFIKKNKIFLRNKQTNKQIEGKNDWFFLKEKKIKNKISHICMMCMGFFMAKNENGKNWNFSLIKIETNSFNGMIRRQISAS